MKLLKFYAEWCGPCKMLSKTMETLDFPMEVVNINIDDDQQTPMKYGIRGVPALVLVDDNEEEVTVVMGMVNKNELIEKFDATEK